MSQWDYTMPHRPALVAMQPQQTRVVFHFEATRGHFLVVTAVGEIDAEMLAALGEYVARQQRRLATESRQPERAPDLAAETPPPVTLQTQPQPPSRSKP